jgi:hypothetical protein
MVIMEQGKDIPTVDCGLLDCLVGDYQCFGGKEQSKGQVMYLICT